MKSLLTFELSKDGDELFIHGNSVGLQDLASKLVRLAEKAKVGQHDHEHLMTEEWAGHELSSKTQSDDTQLLNHVKIYGWPNK
jgi:hypothetical protein